MVMLVHGDRMRIDFRRENPPLSTDSAPFIQAALMLKVLHVAPSTGRVGHDLFTNPSGNADTA
jgi:hypothetical protein